MPLPDVTATVALKTGDFTLKGFFTHSSRAASLNRWRTTRSCRSWWFSLFFVAALASVEKPMETVVGRGLEELTKLMFRITRPRDALCALGVFAAMAAAITVEGVGAGDVRQADRRVLPGPGAAVGGPVPGGLPAAGRSIGRLASLIREPILLAFATASSESAYPKTIEALDRFGVPKRISSFVLPLVTRSTSMVR